MNSAQKNKTVTVEFVNDFLTYKVGDRMENIPLKMAETISYYCMIVSDKIKLDCGTLVNKEQEVFFINEIRDHKNGTLLRVEFLKDTYSQLKPLNVKMYATEHLAKFAWVEKNLVFNIADIRNLMYDVNGRFTFTLMERIITLGLNHVNKK